MQSFFKCNERKKQLVNMALYVDHLNSICISSDLLVKFKGALKKSSRYLILKNFLCALKTGYILSRYEHGTEMNCILGMLETFFRHNCRTYDTWKASVDLKEDCLPGEKVCVRRMLKDIIGSLMYVMINTRPDIVFASLSSQNTHQLCKNHGLEADLLPYRTCACRYIDESTQGSILKSSQHHSDSRNTTPLERRC